MQYNCTGIICVCLCEYMCIVNKQRNDCQYWRSSIVGCCRVELEYAPPSRPPAASFSVAHVNLNRILIRKTKVYRHPHSHLGVCPEVYRNVRGRQGPILSHTGHFIIFVFRPGKQYQGMQRVNCGYVSNRGKYSL